MSWASIMRQRQAKYPSEHFVRFVARNYYHAPDRSKVCFIDLGSGGGAHTTYLINENFNVTAVDSAPGALAHIHADICSLGADVFSDVDCVLDNNTLCHVENPPIQTIKEWLKPGGKFFSIAPTNETVRGHLEGKGYCRCATSEQILKLYEPFEKLEIGLASYPTREGQIYSWLIEATK